MAWYISLVRGDTVCNIINRIVWGKHQMERRGGEGEGGEKGKRGRGGGGGGGERKEREGGEGGR